jgi:D-alanyl-D-alanine carboxypeptidase/D-alanyl-D-alanine-endopeptidase (penicillin-binding protein 4)
VAVRVDDSLFTGPAVSPDWRESYVPSGVVSPVSALAVDAGRVSPTSDAREPDPALAAGRDLARLLAKRGVTVTGEVTRAAAPAGAAELAAVESPTVAELVELMLASSDNDLAEAMLRLVAVGQDRPGTFTDGTAVVQDVLADLGVPTAGTELLDGSGLARGSMVSPATLGRLLVTAADGSHPRLDDLVTGLPVAGFSGTLSLRFGAGRAGTAAGLVRAKTGTLTGVSTLAGVTSVDGRPVVFVVMSDEVPGDTLAARAALDRFAATLAGVESPPGGSG